jgi:hypothetical protein
MNCKDCQKYLPDLLLDAASVSGAQDHLAECPGCFDEFHSLQATLDLLDSWHAPEVSPYFDQKLAVLLRDEQRAAPAGWLERLRCYMLFNTGRQFRPALAGVLAVILLAGAGTVFDLSGPSSKNIQTSAAVTDLQILDRNEQAFQTMDQLLQDDSSPDRGTPSEPAS